MGRYHFMESATRSIHVVQPINKAMKENCIRMSRVLKSHLINFNVCASVVIWSLNFISHMQNPCQSTSGFLGTEEEISRGHPGHRAFTCAKEMAGKRDGVGASKAVVSSKNSRKSPKR